jgi:hypothetical protein
VDQTFNRERRPYQASLYIRAIMTIMLVLMVELLCQAVI